MIARAIRDALRSLGRSPGFACAAIACLAIGIGTTSTAFTLLSAMVLQPPPGVTAPEQLAHIYVARRTGDVQEPIGGALPYIDFLAARAASRTFAGVAAYADRQVHLDRGAAGRRLRAVAVSSSYFDVMGVRPALGRLFRTTPDDRVVGADETVLSYGFWQRRYGGDSSIVGRTIELAERPVVVIGVADREFLGTGDANDYWHEAPVDLWVPLRFAQFDASTGALGPTGGWSWLSLVGRLRPGVGLATAARATEAELRHAAESLQGLDPRPTARITPITSPISIERSHALAVEQWIAVASLLVLVIAIVNVANLLSARAVGRRRRQAVLDAIGASRRDILLALIAECVLLALVGGAIGLMLASWGADAARLLDLPGDPHVDLRVILATLAIAVAVGVACAISPLRAGESGPDGSLLRMTSAISANASRSERHRLLVVQVSLAVALVLMAGVGAASLRRIYASDFGFDVDRLVVAHVDDRAVGYTAAREDALLATVVSRLRAAPGIERATTAQLIPMLAAMSAPVTVPDAGSVPSPALGPYLNFVGPEFFRTLGTPLLAGREIDDHDIAGASPVAVVNQAMARWYWGARNPIGACLRTEADSLPGACRRIVGVVANELAMSIGDAPVPTVFLPLAQETDRTAPLVIVRVRGRPDDVTTMIRQAFLSVGPDLPFVDVQSMGSMLGGQLIPYRMAASILTAYGVLALVLSAVGLYVAVTFSRMQRTREIGVRVALGATPGQVVVTVARDAVMAIVVGTGCGVIAATLASRELASMLEGLRAPPPAVTVGIIVVVGTVTMVACLVPALRALRIDPATAFRVE